MPHRTGAEPGRSQGMRVSSQSRRDEGDDEEVENRRPDHSRSLAAKALRKRRDSGRVIIRLSKGHLCGQEGI